MTPASPTTLSRAPMDDPNNPKYNSNARNDPNAHNIHENTPNDPVDNPMADPVDEPMDDPMTLDNP